MTDPLGAILGAVEAMQLAHERVGRSAVAVALPGEHRLRTACVLTVGDHALDIEAFVVRRPEENEAAVHRYLLRRNARMYAVAWSVDDTGDIYLRGRVPLAAIDAEEVDRILGCVLEYSDGTFNTLLELGFGESIRREWAWRVKNGESLANLAAFEEFVRRPPAAGDPSTAGDGPPRGDRSATGDGAATGP